MVADKKIAWPEQLSLGADGLGNLLDCIRTLMGESMEALIHHFKLVTEAFRVVSDGGTRPYRMHFRDPSFTNLQTVAAMCEGGQAADITVAVAGIDPVMGGVAR